MLHNFNKDFLLASLYAAATIVALVGAAILGVRWAVMVMGG